MKLRKLGNSDIEITPIIMGTWALGGWLWGGTEHNDADKAIQASIDAGINCIDTAAVYGFGLSEELVGKAIRGKRSKLIIATKCGLVWDGRKESTLFFETRDNNGKPVQVNRCLRKKSIFRECDESLKRLDIDVIDLYQCHWPDPNTPIEETVEAFMELRGKGKIRAFGVSNFSVEQTKEWLKHGPLASNQPKYSLLSRDIENDILPFCKEHNVGVICYSPMEMGLLTGKIGMDKQFPDSDTRKNRPWFQPKKRREVLDALEKIKPIATRNDAALGDIAIAWVLHQPGVTAAIVGARNGDQAKANVQAANVSLTDEDLITIKTVFAPLKLDEPFDPATAKR
ncbi:MAG: aldo/keto reductase [Kiritimatiellae bacterium]|nr:aldo/keto reductase [Kiritimatiellia bacterium]MDD5521099.1 aldo/keto reductase [Kiritimatiellia bacterium]